MGLKLSNEFIADIQNKNTNVISSVHIETGQSSSIKLSTNDFHTTSENGSNHYLPLLLKSISINESVDPESRNFKISNVSLKISNFEYNGKRFSDLSQFSSIMNQKVDIFFHTQSTSKVLGDFDYTPEGYICVAHDGNYYPDMPWGDGIWTEEECEGSGGVWASPDDNTSMFNNAIENYFGTTDIYRALTVFKGIIRRMHHTDSIVTLEIEDLSQLKLHKNIPVNYTANSDALGKWKRVPIPIVYGSLKSAPAVIDVGKVIKSDSDDSITLLTSGQGDYENIGVPAGPSTVWGVFEDWGQDGESPVQLLSNEALSYLPMSTVESIFNEDFGASSQIGHQQWQATDVEQEGTVKLTPQMITGTIKAYILQGLVATKSDNIKCEYRATTHSAVSSNNDDIDQAWVFNILNPGFSDVMSEHLSDNNYNNISLFTLNGWLPSNTWEKVYEYNISNYIRRWINQTLIKIKVDAMPTYSYTGLLNEYQFAINGKTFPRMSTTISDIYGSHQLYITARDYRDENTNAGWALENWLESMYFYYIAVYEGHTEPEISFPMPRLMHLGEEIRAPFYAESNQSWLAKDLIQFTSYYNHEDNQGYNEDMPGAIRIDTDTDYGGVGSTMEKYNEFAQFTARPDFLHIAFGLRLKAGYADEGDSASCDVEMTLHGDLNEIDFLRCADFRFDDDVSFFLRVTGRKWDGVLIQNPIDIMLNIAISELGIGMGSIDQDSYIKAREIHNNLKFDFSIYEEIDSKELLEDIAKSTLCYPYFSSNGKLYFASHQQFYEESEWINSMTIKASDVISYSFSKSKMEQVYTKIEFKYNYNYIKDRYDSFLSEPEALYGLYPNNEELAYNGYDDIESNILTFESKYIKDYNTANTVWKWMFRYNKFQRLKFKLKLPIKYVSLQVGDRIKFDKLLGDMRAYGINYTQISSYISGADLNTSALYPLFFITSTKKSIDSVEIQLEQIHTLGGGLEGWGPYEETTIEEEDEVIPEDEDEDYDWGEVGTCVFAWWPELDSEQLYEEICNEDGGTWYPPGTDIDSPDLGPDGQCQLGSSTLIMPQNVCIDEGGTWTPIDNQIMCDDGMTYDPLTGQCIDDFFQDEPEDYEMTEEFGSYNFWPTTPSGSSDGDIYFGGFYEFNLGAFNVVEDGLSYPYFTTDNNAIASEYIHLWDEAMAGSEMNTGWNGTPGTGISIIFGEHNLFRMEIIGENMALLSNNFDYRQFLPPIFSQEHDMITTASSWNYETHSGGSNDFVLFEVVHHNPNEGWWDFNHFNYVYQLKNISNPGEPIQLEWTIAWTNMFGQDGQIDTDFTYTEYGITLLAPFDDPTWGGSKLIFKNFSEYTVKWYPPHEISQPILTNSDYSEPEEPGIGDDDAGGSGGSSEDGPQQDSQGNLMGDWDLDGTVNVLDIVALMAYILGNHDHPSGLHQEYIENLDVNYDGTVNVLDIVKLVNQILGNAPW